MFPNREHEHDVVPNLDISRALDEGDGTTNTLRVL